MGKIATEEIHDLAFSMTEGQHGKALRSALIRLKPQLRRTTMCLCLSMWQLYGVAWGMQPPVCFWEAQVGGLESYDLTQVQFESVIFALAWLKTYERLRLILTCNSRAFDLKRGWHKGVFISMSWIVQLNSVLARLVTRPIIFDRQKTHKREYMTVFSNLFYGHDFSDVLRVCMWLSKTVWLYLSHVMISLHGSKFSGDLTCFIFVPLTYTNFLVCFEHVS